MAAWNDDSQHALVTDLEMMQCVKSCVVCYQTCQSCGYSSLLETELRETGTINRLLDCASLSMASALLVARGSDLARRLTELCADACDRCIDLIGDLPGSQWQECTYACNEASMHCREFAASHNHDH
jgi:hypothetical protein